MKTMHWLRVVTTAALVFWTGAGQAGAATLAVGDPAPKLQVGKWMQGEPLAGLEKGTPYIVEFWATWCGPCIASIPHLNELHLKFKDRGLVVIGQNVWENEEEEVPKFVKKMGAKMSYRVALDNKEGSEKGKMAETWMMAAGQNGIPASFVVNKEGVIAWIGHPMQLEESMLEEIIAGKFDIAKAKAKAEQQAKTAEAANALWKKYQTARNDEEWAAAEGLLDEMEKLTGDDMGTFRLGVHFGKKDWAAALALAKKMDAAHPGKADYKNELAWSIALAEPPSKELLDLAQKISAEANELTQHGNGNYLDTLARLQFLRGEKEAAIATQEKAVAKMEDERGKKRFEATLKSYREGKVPQ